MKVVNSGWIKKGQRLSTSTEFKKGGMPAKPFCKGHRLCIGRKYSQETIEKMSIAHSGVKPTIETRKKMAEAHKGVRSPFWKGGLTTINSVIRQSVDSKLWREAVFKRDNFTCQGCGIHGGKLQADHIKPFAYYPELRFAIDNGRTLCEPCHKATDTYLYKAKQSLAAKLELKT